MKGLREQLRGRHVLGMLETAESIFSSLALFMENTQRCPPVDWVEDTQEARITAARFLVA